jgi:hypothetical protein
MQDQENATLTIRNRAPWNEAKLTGAKPPLRPKHVWSIRTKLQIEGRVRDLAMFNLAIDASFAAAMSWRSKSTKLLQADTLRIAQLYVRSRPVDRCHRKLRRAARNHSGEARSTESHRTKFLWSPDDATGFFILWIAAFTGVPALSTVGRRIATNRTAKISERARIDLERPWRFLDGTTTLQFVHLRSPCGLRRDEAAVGA